MIQVDLAELKTKWYNLGKAGAVMSDENAKLFNSLDSWQKRELIIAFTNGTAEALAAAKQS